MIRSSILALYATLLVGGTSLVGCPSQPTPVERGEPTAPSSIADSPDGDERIWITMEAGGGCTKGQEVMRRAGDATNGNRGLARVYGLAMACVPRLGPRAWPEARRQESTSV